MQLRQIKTIHKLHVGGTNLCMAFILCAYVGIMNDGGRNACNE